MDCTHHVIVGSRARAQYWRECSDEELEDTIVCVIEGRRTPRLDEDELVAGVSGVYGLDSARFVSAVVGGMTSENLRGGPYSFLAIALHADRLDLIDRLLSIPEETLRHVLTLDRGAWMNALGTALDGHIPKKQRVWVHSLYMVAALSNVPLPMAGAAFRVALKHFPEHPDIARVLAGGGPKAAVLTKMLMERRMEPAGPNARAQCASSSRVTPGGSDPLPHPPAAPPRAARRRLGI